MKWFIKGAVVLLVASLIMTVVGCGGEEAKEIKIGVIGPMQFQMGEHHWMGATLAAEEINAAGGVQVGDETYQIKLVQVDSNELVSPPDAATAAERAITVDNVDFLMGTIRSEEDIHCVRL
jgi:branched-chain amino acid transport system substrate-binding protein